MITVIPVYSMWCQQEARPAEVSRLNSTRSVSGPAPLRHSSRYAGLLFSARCRGKVQQFSQIQHRADRKSHTETTTEHLVNFQNKTLCVDASTKKNPTKGTNTSTFLVILWLGTLYVVVFITHTFN